MTRPALLSAQSSEIQIALSSPRRKLIFLTIVLVPTVVLLGWILWVVSAATLGESLDPEIVRCATALDPDNSQLHFNLGTLYLWGEHSDPALAAEQLRTATELNGSVATYWSALGKACYAHGDRLCTERAFRQAADLAPSKSLYAWEAGLNYAISNRPIESTAYLRRCVELQPQRSQDVFALLLRAFGSSELAWNEVAKKSGNVEVQLAFLDLLSKRHDFGTAGRYWSELTAARATVSPRLAKAYLENIIEAGRYEEAQQIWQYLQDQNKGTLRSAASDTSELISNPGFENDPSGIGFDWRLSPRAFVALDFRDPDSHGGTRALRIDFTVPVNDAFEPAFQIVPILAGRTYELTAYARSKDIASDSGPRLRVVDLACPPCLDVTTPGVTGTTEWHQVSATFTTPPTTKALRISVWRPRSRTFPMEIGGQFWVDDISLHLASDIAARN